MSPKHNLSYIIGTENITSYFQIFTRHSFNKSEHNYAHVSIYFNIKLHFLVKVLFKTTNFYFYYIKKKVHANSLQIRLRSEGLY